MIQKDIEEIKDLIEKYKHLSPFELKNKLIEMAKKTEKKGIYTFLNAGRGNPNWTASTPRQAFFTLGQFAVEETKRIMEDGDLAGIPYCEGCGTRFDEYAHTHQDAPGMDLLKKIIDYGVNEHGFERDRWVYELVDGIIGDHYPIPDRMLRCIEKVVYAYLIKEMSGHLPTEQIHDLYAVEGGTAAMCYIFDTLSANHLLNQGDEVALMVPIFTPYLEIPDLSRYAFDVTYIYASELNEEGRHDWQYPQRELDKLKNQRIKALFVVNPSNPPSVAIDEDTMCRLKEIIKNDNPELMIITDDVYGTFADGFRSLMTEIPYNTIGVYSFSKYFGVTGWRLGVIAVAKNNLFDKLIKDLPEIAQRELDHRYDTLSNEPEDITFIDRIVADSRQVALNHTAGLSTPQQVQMAIFSIFALLDQEERYKNQTKAICRRRLELLYKNLELPLYVQAHTTAYYRQIDLLVWAKLKYGDEFVEFLKTNYAPEDLLFRLARNYAVVLLNGNGFQGPDWSIRVSLANLPDEAYEKIGAAINEVFKEYVEAWKSEK